MIAVLSKSKRLLILILAITAIGCANRIDVTPVPKLVPTENPLQDRSFLTDQPCAAPCWYGLEIGKSTKRDVYETVAKLPFIDQTKVKEWETNWDQDRATTEVEIHFECISQPWSNRDCGGVEIYVRENQVKSIWFAPTYNLTLERAVEKLGPPNYVWYRRSTFPLDFDALLVWLERGIIAGQSNIAKRSERTQLMAGKKLARSMQLASVYYFDKRTPPSIDPEYSFTVPWPGFEKNDEK